MKKEFNFDEVVDNAARLLAALSTIVACGEIILENFKTCRNSTSVVDAPKPAKQIASAEPAMSMEEVRAILSSKASAENGKYKADIKALVKKYADGGILKDVKPEDYRNLIAEVEGL